MKIPANFIDLQIRFIPTLRGRHSLIPGRRITVKMNRTDSKLENYRVTDRGRSAPDGRDESSCVHGIPVVPEIFSGSSDDRVAALRR